MVEPRDWTYAPSPPLLVKQICAPSPHLQALASPRYSLTTLLQASHLHNITSHHESDLGASSLHRRETLSLWDSAAASAKL